MDTVTLHIGTVETLSSGRTQDDRRAVEFIGEEVGHLMDEAIELYEGRLTEHEESYSTAFPDVAVEEA